jgi:diaminohydroxyphosphoribosylaminopyrimidine deaminase/5-amino-6-(5-phosphoribosylamino)uracil reductase
VDLRGLLQWLGQEEIRSVLVEGGSKVIASLLRRRLVDHLLVAIAPKILGKGLHSMESAGGLMADNPVLLPSVRYFLAGDDVILQAFMNK